MGRGLQYPCSPVLFLPWRFYSRWADREDVTEAKKSRVAGSANGTNTTTVCIAPNRHELSRAVVALVAVEAGMGERVVQEIDLKEMYMTTSPEGPFSNRVPGRLVVGLGPQGREGCRSF